MNERETINRISSLVSSINSVKKYSVMWGHLLGIVLWTLAVVVSILFTYSVIAYYDYLIVFPALGSFPGIGGSTFGGTSFNILGPAVIAITLSYYFGGKAVKKSLREKVDPIRFSPEKDGILGALKVLRELDSDAILIDIKYAKILQIVIAIAKLVSVWVIASILLYVLFFYAGFVTGIILPFWAVIALSLMVALVIWRSKIAENFKSIWYLEFLLQDLRWLHNKFEDSGFQA